MPILDGHKVEADQIDAAKHRFIGTWRPPLPPKLMEMANLPGNSTASLAGHQKHTGIDCLCGTRIAPTRSANYLKRIREHWQGGCFDEPQYVTITGEIQDA